MTTMFTQRNVLDPNDPDSIQMHQRLVLEEFRHLFELVDEALRRSVLRARDVFALLEGPVDLAVHAGLTRYLCKLFLESQEISAADEESFDFELERVPNCGLCLNQGPSQIRILKATPSGIPKAASEARSRFYSNNQYLLPFFGAEQLSGPLSLVVLWRLDGEFAYKGMEIACPMRERIDGSVDCYWITPWKGEEGKVVPSQIEPLNPDRDLDEIQPLEKRKKASS